MLDREKAIGILALKRLIENGDITVKTDQIYSLYWISYKIINSMKDIDAVVEAEKVVENSIRVNQKV